MSKKKQPTIVALMPMRHNSERIPGKNYRDFAGLPLYHHAAKAILGCPRISRLVINTDSPLIREDAARHFPSITCIERPKELLGGEVSMNRILLYDITQVRADYILQTHSTNPLLTTETIDRAISAFLAGLPEYDSLFSVTAMHTRLWTDQGKPLNHDPSQLLRTQDLPPVYEENSCLYIFSPETLRRRNNRLGERPQMFEIDREEAMDLDEEFDFRLAEMVYKATRKVIPVRPERVALAG